MVGFTREEVNEIIEYYKEELNEFSEDTLEIMKKCYDNYLTEEMNSQTALRDFVDGERSIKKFLRAYRNN